MFNHLNHGSSWAMLTAWSIQLQEWVFYLWITIGVSLLIIELMAPNLFLFVSLALGCGTAAIVSLFSDCIMWQLASMAATSLLSFFVINQLFVKDKKDRVLSNYEALVGQEGVVMQAITHEAPGIVKIRGEQWAAVSDKGVILYKGTVVTVVQVSGNRVIVS